MIFLSKKSSFLWIQILSNIKTIDEQTHAHAPMDEQCELDHVKFSLITKMVHHTPTTMIKT